MGDLAGGRATISAQSVAIITLLQSLHQAIATHLLRPHHLHTPPLKLVSSQCDAAVDLFMSELSLC